MALARSFLCFVSRITRDKFWKVLADSLLFLSFVCTKIETFLSLEVTSHLRWYWKGWTEKKYCNWEILEKRIHWSNIANTFIHKIRNILQHLHKYLQLGLTSHHHFFLWFNTPPWKSHHGKTSLIYFKWSKPNCTLSFEFSTIEW